MLYIISWSSLRLLKLIAKDYNVSMDELNYQQVIQWFEKDSKIRQEKGVDAAVLKW